MGDAGAGTLAVGRGGTGLASYTVGDILYASGATTLSKLAAVASGSVLASQGTTTAPAWNTISAVLDTIGSTRGSILYRGASGWAILAPGTSTYVLTSNGAGADPSYQAIPGGGGGTSFADNTFDVHDDGDATKKLMLECSGITASTTRTWTVQDLSGTVPISPNAATGTDVSGTDFVCFGGQSTGTGVGGKFVFQTSRNSLTGSTPNALITALTFDSIGKLLWGAGLGVPAIVGPSDLDFTINAGTPTVSGTTGRGLVVRGGGGFGAAAGGTLSLEGGSSGATSGAGGSVTVKGGAANTTGSGGTAEVRAGPSAGSNQAGASTFLRGGQGTGTGAGGDLAFEVSVAGSTGSSLNAYVRALTLSGAGNLLVFGNGVTAASPTAFTIQPTSASGSNVAGVDFTYAGSQGTGTGAGGSHVFKVAPAGSTGSSLNSLVTALTIDSTKLVTFAGNASMQTITAGTWNGTKIAEAYGGTNQSTYTTGDLLYASGANTLAKLAVGSTDQVLTVRSGAPSWVERVVPTQASGGRLTIDNASKVPAPTSDQTGKTTVYLVPYLGNGLALWNGTTWRVLKIPDAGVSVALGTLSSGKNYDVFAYDNSGSIALELSAAWFSDSARASGGSGTDLAQVDGVWVKKAAGGANDQTRRYLGTFRTTSTTATEDSASKRYLWNQNNRVPRTLTAQETGTANWTYTTGTWREANGNTTEGGGRVGLVIGDPNGTAEALRATVRAVVGNSSANCRFACGVGVDSTTADSSQSSGSIVNSGGFAPDVATWTGTIATPGYHYLQRLEISQAAGTTTWYGHDTFGGVTLQAGLEGQVYA
jgi:hypothetical protein